jgi:hypothetical protein
MSVTAVGSQQCDRITLGAGATMPVDDGGSRAALMEQARN